MNPTIDPNPTSIGGTILYPVAGPPLPGGSKITIARILPAVQDTSISNQSIVYPPVIEQALDYLTLLIQGGTVDIDRAFKVPFGDPLPVDVPTVDLRKNQLATFDNDGNLTPALFAPGTAVISAAMQPVVAAATIAIAQQLLGTQAMIDAMFKTGDLRATHRTVADPGWIMWVDGTIGNAGSGSTILASIDTNALFSLYYNSYSDVNCPLTLSNGSPTTRAAQGTSSAAFNAGCRMTMPKGSGRSLGISGQGSGLTNRVLGSAVGVESITPSIATMAQHTHVPPGGGAVLADVTDLADLHNMTFSGTADVLYVTLTFAGGNQPMNIMQPTTYINIMVRL